MGRSPCCDESGLKKGPWTPEEDDKLIKYIQKHGHGSWRALPKLADVERVVGFVGRTISGPISREESSLKKRSKLSSISMPFLATRGDMILVAEISGRLHLMWDSFAVLWSAIATHLPGRTDNEIKNFWNTHLKKKLIQMGFDPMTHRPRTDIFSNLNNLIALANLIENPMWEEQAMRLQAEAVQMARLSQYLQYISTTLPSIPDITTFSLLNSPKDSPILTSAPSLSYFQDQSAPFAHLPNLQTACDIQASECATGKNLAAGPSPSSPWQMPEDISPLAAAAPVTETSITNTGDVCSSSSYGGNQMWSELLDDPLFNEIA
ncbi:UNVERIFIED_CONTAM: Transcription factor MYB93 [Sesamum indicum]